MWNSPADLVAARNDSTIHEGSLLKKAKDTEGLKPSDKNKVFLDKLIGAGKITKDDRAKIEQCLRSIGADNPLKTKMDKILLYASFVETFGMKDIANLLVQNGSFATVASATARVTATGIAIDTIVQGTDLEDGKALGTAMRVGDLHHALIKTGAARATDGSSVMLINQLTLAYTLLTFSTTPARTLARVALVDNSVRPATPEQQRDWLHFWNIVGSLMGIDDRALPQSLADAQKLLNLIEGNAWFYSVTDNAKTLTRTMIAAVPNRADYCRYAGTTLMTSLGVACP